MRTRVAIVVLAVLTNVSPGRAERRRLTGVIVGIHGEPPSTPTLEIASKLETRTVRTDGDTKYLKWITHHPWQQDTKASVKTLTEGLCVQVELRSGSSVAKTIRISDEPPGSLHDPCRVPAAPEKSRRF